MFRPILNLPRAGLALMGRYASAAFALSILLGLALPQLAAALKPAIPVSIFCFIVLSFARANAEGIRRTLSRPGRLGAALVLSTLIPPLIGLVAIAALGPERIDPGLRLAIALMAAAPPLMASPAFASVLGLENSLILTILVIGMAITPASAPFLASLLAGAEVPLDPVALSIRLLIFIGGGMLGGLLLRRLVRPEAFVRARQELDGVNVLLFFLFAIAAMDGVIAATLADPLRTAFYLGCSTVLAAVGFAIAWLLGRQLGESDRFALAIGIGLRNMGLLVAPILSLIPSTTFLYFARAQVPIYFAPIALEALWRHGAAKRANPPPGA